ncbi:universal stress protein [Methylovirgula sp. 4M-Z18]|uniref:universal stress protein n=1 Tax=Methylovirgula sp. 4M-Z18 TaxID=2293567 RepID=UPI0011C04B1C|nr:universal stress protein [Methylovirgula sp. 4M-Z18]
MPKIDGILIQRKARRRACLKKARRNSVSLTMTIKSILSVIAAGQSDDDIRAAIALCQSVNAHLSLLIIALAPSPPMADFGISGSSLWVDALENDVATLHQRGAQVRTLLAREDLSSDVEGEYVEMARAAETIGQRACYADLVLIGSDLQNHEDVRLRAIIGALFDSSVPLLLSQRTATTTLQPRTIVLAWDSSVEASRAVHASLGLLRKAQKVHVTMVDPDAFYHINGAEPGADVGAYLARHGVTAIVERLPSAGSCVADVLKQHATDVAADMIVMGAYGHSRWRERIFGGVTQAMLTDAPVPVYLAH